MQQKTTCISTTMQALSYIVEGPQRVHHGLLTKMYTTATYVRS